MLRNLRNEKARFVMYRVITGDYDDKQKQKRLTRYGKIQKFSSEWLMRGDVGCIWTFILLPCSTLLLQTVQLYILFYILKFISVFFQVRTGKEEACVTFGCE